MEPEHLRYVDRQGAVHEYRHFRDAVGHFEAFQGVDEFLGAFQGKRRHDQLAAAVMGAVDGFGQIMVQRLDRFVVPVPVGAFHDHDIGVVGLPRVFEYGRVLLSDIPGIDEPAAGTVLGKLDQQHGRTQYVPGVFERHLDAGNHLEADVVRNADEPPHDLADVHIGIQRRDEGLVLLGQPLRVLFLNGLSRA